MYSLDKQGKFKIVVRVFTGKRLIGYMVTNVGFIIRQTMECNFGKVDNSSYIQRINVEPIQGTVYLGVLQSDLIIAQRLAQVTSLRRFLGRDNSGVYALIITRQNNLKLLSYALRQQQSVGSTYGSIYA